MNRSRGIRRRTVRGLLRSLVSPVACGAAVAVASTVIVLERAVAVVEESSEVGAEVASLAARLAAEAAASAFVASGGGEADLEVDTGGGLVVRTNVAADEGGELRLTANVGEHRFDYAFRRLEGGNPLALGRPFTLAPSAAVPPQWLEVNEAVREPLPSFGPAEPDDADRLAACAIVLDAGVALEHWPAGTDAPDYVLGGGHSGQAPKVPASGVLHVPGNLWLDATGPALELQLRRDLTIVVHGNVYLGRSISVRGPGTLTLAVSSDAGCSFVDRDGNGRFGADDELLGAAAFRGPIEGSGNVYLGMSRDGVEQLELQAGLIVPGALHIRASLVRVHGPVAVGGAGLALGAREGRLLCTGLRLPGHRRAALPGFAAVGSPRPSALRPLGQEPLYAAAPPR